MAIDHIETLIKSFAGQGKRRSEVITELMHEGHNPGDIERAMNNLRASDELPAQFWDGSTFALGASSAQKISPAHSKKILIWIVTLIVVGILAYVGLSWYQNLPRIIANNAYTNLTSARSFEFSISAEGIGVQGIVITDPSAVSMRVEVPRAALPILSFIKKGNGDLLFKTEGDHVLTQYAWIDANPQDFFSESHRFGLDAFSNRATVLRDFSSERKVFALRAVDRILHGPVEKPFIEIPAGTRGAILQADAVFKRQFVEQIIGPYDGDFLDDLLVAQWHLLVSKKSPKTYTLSITSPERAIAGVLDSVTVQIRNPNMHTDIPFDAVTTPFEQILIWEDAR